jgi:nicotinate-nucleotide adenylyltransferase
MRLGILGGTFDPPHNGHLLIASEAQERLNFAQVIFVPAQQPPHKPNEPITPFATRVAMLECALYGKASFVISMVEAQRPGPSYTVDTLRAMRQEYAPNTELFFIMGMDSLANFATWHAPDEIVKLCKLAVLERPGYRVDLDTLEAKVPGVKSAVVFVPAPELDISASEVRERAARGESLSGLVPPAVEQYIIENRLYQE